MTVEDAARRLWTALPPGARTRLKPLALRATRALPAPVAAVLPAPPADDVEVIRTLDEVDQKLEEIDAAHQVSDDAMRAVFRSFRMEFPLPLPDDPTSPEYAARQFEVYRRISGRDGYDVANERNDFPMRPERPFPYYTESWDTVANQIMAIGFIIKTMALPSGARVLELGAGWGNTSVELARMGYDVTVVDIEPRFTELVAERGRRLGLEIATLATGFLDLDALTGPYDAVLFFEAFHHCSDHVALLRSLHRLLAPGGRVFFAAEPITDAFPLPWGLRLDGESLWAIRRQGWLELGFQESYFLRALARTGYVARKHVAADTHLGVVFAARPAHGTYELGTFDLPPDEDATWAAPETDATLHQRYTSARSRLTVEVGGPYGEVEVSGVNPAPLPLAYTVTHGAGQVQGEAAPGALFAIRVPYDPDATALELRSATFVPAKVQRSGDRRRLGLGVQRVTLR